MSQQPEPSRWNLFDLFDQPDFDYADNQSDFEIGSKKKKTVLKNNNIVVGSVMVIIWPEEARISNLGGAHVVQGTLLTMGGALIIAMQVYMYIIYNSWAIK